MEDTQTAISVDVTDPDLMDDHTITIVADQNPDGWTYEGDGLFAESDSAEFTVRFPNASLRLRERRFNRDCDRQRCF